MKSLFNSIVTLDHFAELNIGIMRVISLNITVHPKLKSQHVGKIGNCPTRFLYVVRKTKQTSISGIFFKKYRLIL